MQDRQRPRVLMVTPRYFPDMGGIETHVHEVGQRLVRQGVDITLLTTRPAVGGRNVATEDNIGGMRVRRVENWCPQRDYYIAPEIFFIIKHGNWDFIHCQGCHTFVPPLTMLAAKAAHIPYIVTFHTGGHSSSWRNHVRSTQWHLLSPLLRSAKRLIGVSHFEANYFRSLLHLPARQFAVIPNGGTLPLVHDTCDLSSDQKLILSVGRLERYKGHHHLIMALPLIRRGCPDARLLIVGSGPYEGALRLLAQQQHVAEHVEIRAVEPGNRQEMAQLFARAALVTLLSEYEAHPVSVMEALALCRPVLVSATSGLRELAQQGLAQAIPLKSTPIEIARAVLQQLSEPHTSSAAVSLPTWDDCAQQYLQVYTSVYRTSTWAQPEEPILERGKLEQCAS